MPKETISTGTSTTLIIILFAIALIIRIIFALATPIKIWDETIYLNLGADLSHNPFDYSFTNGWSDYIPFTRDEVYGYPNAGFRAPLLPYLLAFLYATHLDSVIPFLMPLIGAVSVILVYLLGKEFFNKSIGLLAALFFAFLPLHVLWSGRVLTDAFVTFFVLLAFLSFWKGYEKGKNTYKILFGIIAAFTLLSRYTALWIFPIFLIYVLLRGTIWQLLSDKYTWFSIIIFFIILTPWFIYSIYTYHHPFGAFIHGAVASEYWGGQQPWYEYFKYWWELFSVPGFILIAAFAFIIYKQKFLKKEVLLLMLWFTCFLAAAIYTSHKEDRFILPLAPALVLISAYAIVQIKQFKRVVVIISVAILAYSLNTKFHTVYADHNNTNTQCSAQIGTKLRTLPGEYLLVSENSPLFRYYARQETVYYPDPITEESITTLVNSTDKNVAFVFTRYNSGLSEEKWKTLNNIMSKNFNVAFECEKDREKNWIFVTHSTHDQENLVPNGAFESDQAIMWVTNTTTHSSIDRNNRSDRLDSTKSAKMVGTTQETDLHSAPIPIEFGTTYQFKAYADAIDLQEGELGFIIDEYNVAKQWVRATWLKNAFLNDETYLTALYTSSSPTVHAIRIHIYLAKSTKGTAYLDNFQLYKINNQK